MSNASTTRPLGLLLLRDDKIGILLPQKRNNKIRITTNHRLNSSQMTIFDEFNSI